MNIGQHPCIVELIANNNLLRYITAHEIAHVLGATHPLEDRRHQIMISPARDPTPDHLDSRRFSELDEDVFSKSLFYR